MEKWVSGQLDVEIGGEVGRAMGVWLDGVMSGWRDGEME